MSLIQAEIIAKAEHYCAYQERCHQEVKNKLYQLGCNTDTVNEVMVRLIETNYLNEERFAKAYAGGKFRTKKWGRVKIRQELKLRKISEYCIKSAMKEIDESDYWDTLMELIEKKMTVSFAWQEQHKLTKWLLGRGYELALIQDAMQEVISGRKGD